MDDAQDEELVQPPRRDWPRIGRPLGVLVGVGVVAAGVITISSSGSDERRRPAPSTVSVQVFTPAFPRQDVLPAVEVGQLPLCPTGRICETSYDLPDAPEASLRAHFPGARVVDSRTLVARRTPNATDLVARVILARVDDITIAVSMLPPTPNDVADASTEDDGARFHGTAAEHVLGLTVSVSVTGPTGAHVSLGTLQDFVGDRRVPKIRVEVKIKSMYLSGYMPSVQK